MPEIFDISKKCMLGCGLTLAMTAPLQSAPAETVIYSFCQKTNCTDGENPSASLFRDDAGNLYGTTALGGANGLGTAFKLAPSGTETVVYSFRGGSDGSYPYAGLISDRAGNLYGTTLYGGGTGCAGIGCGTVFKLAADGSETVLHSFAGAPTDGGGPYSGNLLRDISGNLYGTTLYGGSSGNCSGNGGCGTAFMLAQDGTETVLHSFSGSDGAGPYAGLIKDHAGYLYGTTGFGGNGGCNIYGNLGCGTVFKLAPDGSETVLYSFTCGVDGAVPVAGLISDNAGNLYGTATYGGNQACEPHHYAGAGAVFKLAPDGTERVLYTFSNQGAKSGLIEDSMGNLYGTTRGGGLYRVGTAFKLAPDGHETVLHSFKGGSDGAYPSARLIKDKAGYLYGTTAWGGGTGCNDLGCGTVFTLKE